MAGHSGGKLGRGRLNETSMADAVLSHRLARRDDIPALTVLIEAAIEELQKSFLDDAH